MSFFVFILFALSAAVSLGFGIFDILQPEYLPDEVALCFGFTLFFSLLALLQLLSPRPAK